MDENTTTQNPAPETQAHPAGLGPMIGAAIILGLIIVGGVYFYGLQLQQKHQDEPLPLILGNETMPSDAPADDAATIEADVDAADMTELESQIDADLNALEGAL